MQNPDPVGSAREEDVHRAGERILGELGTNQHRQAVDPLRPSTRAVARIPAPPGKRQHPRGCERELRRCEPGAPRPDPRGPAPRPPRRRSRCAVARSRGAVATKAPERPGRTPSVPSPPAACASTSDAGSSAPCPGRTSPWLSPDWPSSASAALASCSVQCRQLRLRPSAVFDSSSIATSDYARSGSKAGAEGRQSRRGYEAR